MAADNKISDAPEYELSLINQGLSNGDLRSQSSPHCRLIGMTGANEHECTNDDLTTQGRWYTEASKPHFAAASLVFYSGDSVAQGGGRSFVTINWLVYEHFLIIILSFKLFIKQKYQKYLRICWFSVFLHQGKFDIFENWTAGQTNQAIRGSLCALGNGDGCFSLFAGI